MSECQQSFIRQKIKANLYLDSLVVERKWEQHEIGISTVHLSEQNVPGGGGYCHI